MRLGLGLSLANQGGAGGISSPIPLSGLSLWLKADAGVSTTPEQFISQIIISGAGTTTSNGTYTRASGGLTTFTGPNGNYIDSSGGAEWALFDTQLYDPDGEDYGNNSYYTEDFANWSIAGENLGESPAPSGTITNSTTGINLVTNWADQSGSGHSVEALCNYPTYNSSVINSKPAIDFFETALSGPIGFNFENDNTLFIVFKARNVTAGALWGQGAGEFISALSGGYTQISNSNVEGVVTSNTASSVNTTYLFASRNSSNNFTIYLNGNQTGSTSYSGFAGASTSQFIGADYEEDEPNYFYNGYIPEIIIYNRAITTPERQQVEAYLMGKYAI